MNRVSASTISTNNLTPDLFDTLTPEPKEGTNDMEPTAPTNEETDAMTKAPTKATTKAPAKKTTKAKPKAEPKPKPEKPTPVMVDGFELKDTTESEAKAIAAETEAVAKAVQAIADKENDLLSSYMTLGKFASEVAPRFKSTKLYGQYLAKAAPASQTLDAPLRSNCKWLYEALHNPDHKDADLLATLGLNPRANDKQAEMAKFKSGNPTVIKRSYNDAKKEADKRQKAIEAGVNPDDDDELAKMQQAEKDKASASSKRKVTKAVKNLVRYCNAQEEKADALAEIEDTLKEMFNGHKSTDAMLNFLNDLS